MKKGIQAVIAAVLLLTAGTVQAQVVGPAVRIPFTGGGGGTTILTSGTTATSGCIAGGVLRSISNLVECGAGFTYAAGVATVGSSGIPGSLQLTFDGTGANTFFLRPSTALGGTGVLGINTSKYIALGQDEANTLLWLTSATTVNPWLKGGNGAATFYMSGGSTGFEFYDRAGSILKYSIPDSGGMTIGSASVTGTTVPLTVNNGTSTGDIAKFQSAGSDLVTITDGGQILGPSNAVTYSFSGSSTYGLQHTSASNRVGFVTGGSTYLASSTTNGTEVSADGVTFFSSTVNAGSADTRLQREAAATLQMGADVNGAAVNQTFKAHDGITGTDISGANLTIAAGRGTGAGTGGTVIFQTAPVGSTGTTAQTLATVLTLPKSGGIQVATGTKPTCDSGVRGTIYYVAGGAGVLDTLEVCRKDAADNYAWVSLF